MKTLSLKILIATCLSLSFIPLLVWHRASLPALPVPYPRPHTLPIPHFIAHGASTCLPAISPYLIESATLRRATCRKYSPFTSSRARMATVTAHFGPPEEHYKKALETHLVHGLIHGMEVKVLCDSIVDKLWNKPAFILEVLMQEMVKPRRERLEWIQWVDRDTLVLDPCRPVESFLPPSKSRTSSSSWSDSSADHHHHHQDAADEELEGEGEASGFSRKLANTTHLLTTRDLNGLNNGIFLLRVSPWSLRLMTAILAFRTYKPRTPLPFTEQSAMELILQTPLFAPHVQYVPQHWFNAYDYGGPLLYQSRGGNETTELESQWVRRGDYLVHFAGREDKRGVIGSWVGVLEGMGDVWEEKRVVRDVSGEVEGFWEGLEGG